VHVNLQNVRMRSSGKNGKNSASIFIRSLGDPQFVDAARDDYVYGPARLPLL
jgi:hypothetical protein